MVLKTLSPPSDSRPSGDRLYLQVIDLRTMIVEQVLGDTVQPGIDQGIYYQTKGQGENHFPSPFFRNLLFSEVQDRVQKQHGEDLFSLINTAFFEQHEASTQLAFPLKHQGQVVTGGNSPYGPRAQPKDEQFRGVTLLALTWGPGQVAIAPYDPKTGSPLRDGPLAEGLVSYDYRDHPAYRYIRDTPNRFHVLGTANADGEPGDELLAIATVNRATLDQAAATLREVGIKSPIMTIDGGISTYLFTPKTGALMVPGPTNSASRQLPHYLLIRRASQ